MENLPENWKLVESYDGNFIFEDELQEFCVSADFTKDIKPPYEIWFNQLKGSFTRIGFEDGAYSAHAFNETEALQKAVEMMGFINRKTLSPLSH